MTTDNGSRCGYCSQPADGTHLCTPCTDALRAALRRIADLWADLADATGKRLNQTQGGYTSGTPERGLMFNPRASDLQRSIGAAVDRLTLRIATRTHATPPTGTPERAAWCEARAFAARFIPSIAADRGDLDYLAREMHSTVDKPNRRIPIPVPCPTCNGPMEAELRRPRVITCKSCGAEHDATTFLAAG